jgi:hypothetical protein
LASGLTVTGSALDERAANMTLAAATRIIERDERSMRIKPTFSPSSIT